MKTPNVQVSVRKCKSVSEQHLKKTKLLVGKPLKSFPIKETKETLCKSETSINKNLIAFKDSASTSEPQLIPSPRTPKYPKEVLRKSLIKLRSNQWDESTSALRDVVQISRFNPQLLLKSMPIIYKGITTLLKSLRPAAARTACQAANELFMNMPSVEGLEFDELVHVLLQKTADGNKSLRKDALEALDSMIIHVPPSRSIKILLHRRIAGYNASVRATATKLLACVFHISDGDSTITEETKIRLITAALRFLQDDSTDIKFHGVRLVTMLMHHKDYEDVFRTKINASVLDRINKIMDTVKGALEP